MYTNCSVRLYVTRVDRGRVCRWAHQERASRASPASCCVNHLHALIIDEFIQLANSFNCVNGEGPRRSVLILNIFSKRICQKHECIKA